MFTRTRIEKQAAEIRSNLNLIEQLQDSAITCVLYVIYEVLTIIALYRTHVVFGLENLSIGCLTTCNNNERYVFSNELTKTTEKFLAQV